MPLVKIFVSQGEGDTLGSFFTYCENYCEISSTPWVASILAGTQSPHGIPVWSPVEPQRRCILLYKKKEAIFEGKKLKFTKMLSPFYIAFVQGMNINFTDVFPL